LSIFWGKKQNQFTRTVASGNSERSGHIPLHVHKVSERRSDLWLCRTMGILVGVSMHAVEQ
jgi:hypothetical protein